jgi:hypothetical protein
VVDKWDAAWRVGRGTERGTTKEKGNGMILNWWSIMHFTFGNLMLFMRVLWVLVILIMVPVKTNFSWALWNRYLGSGLYYMPTIIFCRWKNACFFDWMQLCIPTISFNWILLCMLAIYLIGFSCVCLPFIWLNSVDYVEKFLIGSTCTYPPFWLDSLIHTFNSVDWIRWYIPQFLSICVFFLQLSIRMWAYSSFCKPFW